jgi:hypothetical protein
MTHNPAVPPERLFKHIFRDLEGELVAFTGRQLSLDDPDAADNMLGDIRQSYFDYPDEVDAASDHLVDEAHVGRDTYFGVHLFRERGNRKAANSVGTVHALWLDEDHGRFPDEGPEPTAVINSSAARRHLYWRLSRPVSVEWAVTMNRRIAEWAGGDSGKAALASVLRPPGTFNYKRHPQIDPVTAVIHDYPWVPEILEQAIPVSETGAARPRRPAGEYDGPEIDLADYLDNPDLEVIGELSDGHGVKFAIVCPWVDEHSGGDYSGTRIGQREGGGLWFWCDHAHCEERTWWDFKKKIRRIRRASLTRHSNPNSIKIARLNRG